MKDSRFRQGPIVLNVEVFAAVENDGPDLGSGKREPVVEKGDTGWKPVPQRLEGERRHRLETGATNKLSRPHGS